MTSLVFSSTQVLFLTTGTREAENVEFEDKSTISYVSSTFSILNTYIVLQVKSGAQTLLKQIPVFTDFLLRRFSKCFVISFLNLIVWHTYCK
jgi:hypothetical protein